jgi:hypothetical protein
MFIGILRYVSQAFPDLTQACQSNFRKLSNLAMMHAQLLPFIILLQPLVGMVRR